MVVLDCQGVGYELHISLYTFERLKDQAEAKVYAHLAVKEDAHTLFGFFDEAERQLFRQLISVQGIGASIARMILRGRCMSRKNAIPASPILRMSHQWR